MASRDKINGSNSYPRKWRGWRVVREIAGFVILEVIVVAVFFCFYGSKREEFEFVRALTLGMGAVGGAYGLILAAFRSVKFYEQVETGQKQLFNQQLGQGATLLASEKMPIRRTGIRVLGDLAETALNKSLSEETIEQAQLIMRTIHDFVHANACSRSGGEPKRRDIALGIKTLGSLYNKSGQKVKLKKLVQFRGRYLEKLNFTDAELQGVNFTAAKLQGASFIGAELQGADFQWADCTNADFSGAKNLTEDDVKGMIFNVARPPKLPDGLENYSDHNRIYRYYNYSYYFLKSDAEWSEKHVHTYLFEVGIIKSEDD